MPITTKTGDYFDADRELFLTNLDIAFQTSVYDGWGNLTAERYYDLDGSLLARWEYGPDGNVISRN